MLKLLFPNITTSLFFVVGIILFFLAISLWKSHKYMVRYLILPIALIVGIKTFFSFKNASKKPYKPMSSTAMFKKMEYIEHLKLVSFYSEEVMVLGTKEKVQRLVDRLQEEYGNLQREVNWNDTLYIQSQEKLDSVIQKQVEIKDAFNANSEQRKRFVQGAKSFRKCNSRTSCMLPLIFRDSITMAKIDGLILAYTLYQHEDSLYQQVKKYWDQKPWKGLKRKQRKAIRQILKDSLNLREVQLEDLHQNVVRILEREVELKQKLFEDGKQEFKAIKKLERNAKDSFVKYRNESRRAWRNSLDKLKKVKNRLEKAELELAFARESGDEIDPEILIVAPAEVSVYINMKKVVMNMEEFEDSLVRLYIPPIEFDPVLIELPEENVYEMDGNKTELELSRQGVYYDLFGQLKEAVLEKEIEVKVKAIENNIVEEGRRMAEIYLENFMRPLGLKVEIVPLEEER